MSAAFWVAGGTQGRTAGVADRRHASLYVAGVLARVGPSGAEGVLYERELKGPGCCFKGLAADGERLLVCAEAEVLTVGGGVVLDRFSEPRLNDVHHAIRHGGVLHVACTGADGVLVGDRFVAVAEGAHEPLGDVRDLDLAPHRVHPNHVFVSQNRVFATRGMAGDAVSLDGTVRWPLADVVVHDGIVRPDGVWFTAVDGRLVRVDPARGEVDREVDLAVLGDRAPPLGWCRGLAFDGDVAWVGFTRLRATRFRQHLAWVRGTLRGRRVATAHPTRIVAFDLRTHAQVAEICVEDLGLDAVFGLVRCPDVEGYLDPLEPETL